MSPYFPIKKNPTPLRSPRDQACTYFPPHFFHDRHLDYTVARAISVQNTRGGHEKKKKINRYPPPADQPEKNSHLPRKREDSAGQEKSPRLPITFALLSLSLSAKRPQEQHRAALSRCKNRARKRSSGRAQKSRSHCTSVSLARNNENTAHVAANKSTKSAKLIDVYTCIYPRVGLKKHGAGNRSDSEDIRLGNEIRWKSTTTTSISRGRNERPLIRLPVSKEKERERVLGSIRASDKRPTLLAAPASRSLSDAMGKRRGRGAGPEHVGSRGWCATLSA